jgi:hypothetical protein
MTSRIRLLFSGESVGVVELQSWSPSSDAMALDVTPASVVAGKSATVTTTLTNQGRLGRDVEVRLVLPAGWTAEALTSPTKHRLPPSGRLVTRWSVTAPADSAPCSAAVLTAEARYADGLTRARAPLNVVDDPSVRHGLRGDYHLATAPGAFDFGQLKATVVDPNIDMADLTPVLTSLTGREDDVTVRWTGTIEPRATGTYTFSMTGDNGFRLWVDGKPVIDHWVDDWDKEQTGIPVALEAGRRYDLKIEYFEHFGGANLHLSWEGPGLPKQIVPTCSLYPPA